jgi:hypothetical protein
MSKPDSKRTTKKSQAQLRRLAKRAAERDHLLAVELQKRLDTEAAGRQAVQEEKGPDWLKSFLAEEERKQKEMEEGDLALAKKLLEEEERKRRDAEDADRAFALALQKEDERKRPAHVGGGAPVASAAKGAKIEKKTQLFDEETWEDAEDALSLSAILEAEEQARQKRRQAEESAGLALALSLAEGRPRAPEPLDEEKAGVHRCPRCRIPLSVLQDVNCGVFVCGATKEGQLDPHGASRGGLVAGCGQPLRLQGNQLVV